MTENVERRLAEDAARFRDEAEGLDVAGFTERTLAYCRKDMNLQHPVGECPYDAPEPDYCGCCGGLASEPPKGEHGRCCATLHDTGLSRAGLAQNAQGHEVELDWYKQLPPPPITDTFS